MVDEGKGADDEAGADLEAGSTQVERTEAVELQVEERIS